MAPCTATKSAAVMGMWLHTSDFGLRLEPRRSTKRCMRATVCNGTEDESGVARHLLVVHEVRRDECGAEVAQPHRLGHVVVRRHGAEHGRHQEQRRAADGTAQVKKWGECQRRLTGRGRNLNRLLSKLTPRRVWQARFPSNSGSPCEGTCP